MKILLTGGAGFLGSRLLKKLKHFGHKVKSIDLVAHEGGEIGDILNANLWRGLLLESFDYVIHCAAKTNTKESYKQERDYFLVNKKGSEHVAEYAKISGTKLIAFSSDSAVDGDSPFAYSKKEADNLLLSYSSQLTELLIFRLFNVYELGSDKKDLFSILDKARKDKGEVELHYGGVQMKDFIHVDDVTDFIVSAVQRTPQQIQNRPKRVIYEIGTGKEVSIKDVANAFGVRWRKVPPKLGDPYISSADISSTVADFGFNPKVNVLEEIAGTSKKRELPPPVIIKEEVKVVAKPKAIVAPIQEQVPVSKKRGPYKKKKKRGPKPKDKKK